MKAYRRSLRALGDDRWDQEDLVTNSSPPAALDVSYRAGGLHLARRHRAAVQALESDVVRRGVGAGDVDGARLIGIDGEH